MEIKLNSTNLNILKDRYKIYSYLSGSFTKSYFKIDGNSFNYYLRGSLGMMRTSFEVETTNTDKYYFSVDTSKWMNALQKFDYADNINITLTKSLIKINTDSSNDIINLGITTYADGSSEASILDTFIVSNEPTFDDAKLYLTEDLLDNLYLASSLFTIQGKVNSIGLGPRGVIYADRATILKSYFTEDLDMDIFKNLSEDDAYIYVHNFTIGLLPLIAKLSEDNYIRFTPDYGTIYWSDDNSTIILSSEHRELSLPSDEMLDQIAPQDMEGQFDVDIEELKNDLAFFTGFYEGSVWKPITITSVANKEITLRYRHPSADITKEIPNVTCDYDGTFILESESLRKILSKVKIKDDPTVTFSFDEESIGVRCSIGKQCDVVFAKLEDDLEV